MNDLRDLSWQSQPSSGQARQQTNTSANYNPIYQRQNNPFSINSSNGGNSATQSKQTSTSIPANKQSFSSGSNQDSFGGLVDFGMPKKVDSSKMSLAQQAAHLKAIQAQTSNSSYSDTAFFEAQLSRPSSTKPIPNAQKDIFTFAQLKKTDTETSEDILAQINGDRPVDRSSFYPPPPSPTRERQPDPMSFDMMDQGNVRDSSAAKQNILEHDDDDDILGALGKPVVTMPKPSNETLMSASRSPPRQHSFTPSSSDSSDDEDFRRAKAESLKSTRNPSAKAAPTVLDSSIQQLIDMGYTHRQAQVALAQTETGMDLEAAIELLLSLETLGSGNSPRKLPTTQSSDNRQRQAGKPPQQSSRLPNESGDWVDSTYDLASKTLASANTWFSNKSALARRKLAEYNAETAAQTHASRFDERPKWMRDAEKYERKEKGKSKAREDEDAAVREEGLPMHPSERRRLELNGVLPTSPRRGSVDSQKSAKSITGSIRSIPESIRSMGTSLIPPANGASTGPQVHQNTVASDSRRFKANDDEASTFISSRRRRPAPDSKIAEAQPSSIVDPPKSKNSELMEQEDDLFGDPSRSLGRNKGKGKAKAPTAEVEDDIFAAPTGSRVVEEVDLFSAPKTQASISAPTTQSRRRKAGNRQVPYLDATILATSSQQRLRGSEFFKKGDFVKALACYQISLQDVPSMHPVRILSLTNRAITQIQLGAPKPALEDCEEALKIIGGEKGQNEVVEDSGKQTAMTALWAKAMSRKASALEMQERNADALEVWQELVRSGLGGPSAIQSRQRCENMLAPQVKVAAPVKARAPPTSSSQASQAAIRKLREDDARTAQTEAEKDSLYAVVNDRITAWSAGKETNLRALLSSLDQVLWPTSGWKKVTLADLVINAKVKIIYMKALAKVHPDKISRTASVEEKMIAAGVFAKLNGAWDSFKAQNNM